LPYYLTNGFQSANTYISIYTIFLTGSLETVVIPFAV